MDVHPRCWTPTSVCAVTISLVFLYDLDRHSQPSRQGCHSWKLQDQPFAFLQTIWYCLHFPIRLFNMHSIGFLLRATKPE